MPPSPQVKHLHHFVFCVSWIILFNTYRTANDRSSDIFNFLLAGFAVVLFEISSWYWARK